MALTKVGKEGITGISNSSDATAITINSSENIGIGTGTITNTSNYRNIHIEGTTGTIMRFMSDGTQVGQIQSDTNEFQLNAVTSDPMVFKTNNTERMRIDSSGNLLVGKTSSSISGAGHVHNSNGVMYHTADGTRPLDLNRETSDGDIAIFRKDGTIIGLIGTEGDDITIGKGDTAIQFKAGNNAIRPWNAGTNSSRDSATDLGMSGDRFEDIFATNTVIQSSDQNEKQQIASLTTAEITAAKALSKLFKTFKWNSAVTAKGDAARTHTGHIAQEVQTAMSDAGLDASKYAFWCSDTWWETSTDVPAVEADEKAGIEARDAYTRIDKYYTVDDAPEGATERTRLGVRYPELLAFIGAATEQRLTDIETRLTALEGS